MKIAVDTKAGNSCVLLRTPMKNEEYQEYLSSDNCDGEEEVEAYDPEMDSPSSWTTKASNDAEMKPTEDHKKLMMMKATQWASNILLLSFIIAGVVYGVLHKDDNESVILLVFGALAFSSVSLILVNASWSFRGKHSFPFQYQKINCTCPTVQVVGSFIILFAGICLIPTYYRERTSILVIVFGVMLLLIMVNIPLVFGGEEERVAKDETSDGVEVVPGNMETVSIPVEVEEDRRDRTGPLAFYKLR